MWRLAACAVSLLTIGCATLATGRQETIAVSSSPAGADARLVCERSTQAGVTPVRMTIRRNTGDCLLTVSKDGYEEKAVAIEQGVNPAYWTNLIFAPVSPAGVYVVALGDPGEKALGLGLIGAGLVIFGTDFATGAVHTHRPNSIDLVLQPSVKVGQRPPATTAQRAWTSFR